MANPYAVTPFGGANVGQMYGQTLTGIGQAIGQKRQQDAAMQKQAEGKQAIASAFQSGDPNQIAQTMIDYPDLAQSLQQAMKFKSDSTRDNFIQSAREVVLNPQDTEQILTRRIEQVTAEGGDPSQSISALDEYRENPEQFLQSAKNVYAAYDPTGFQSYQKAQPEKEEMKVGRFQYKDTPDGFLKVDTSTGEESEIKVGSKEAKRIEDKRVAEIDRELELEGDIFDKSKKIRDRYDTKSKEFISVRDAYDRVKASVEEPDAAGDIALIFNYMKMLDPGSVVREGEFATAQNAGGVPDSIRNTFNRLLDGERLNQKQRAMFSGRAEKLFNKAKSSNQKDYDETLRIGKRYGISEEDIFGEPEKEAQKDEFKSNVVITSHPQFGDVTEDDIAETMRANNMTREQVLAQLGVQ